jgi:hypothetical protein
MEVLVDEDAENIVKTVISNKSLGFYELSLSCVIKCSLKLQICAWFCVGIHRCEIYSLLLSEINYVFYNVESRGAALFCGKEITW